METAFGGMGLLFLLLGGLAIAGLAGGGSDSDDDPRTDTDTDDDSLTEIPQETRPGLNGTAADDMLTGNAGTGDILGLAGNDLIISAGANGTLDGGAGADGIALNTGEATLTGGTGADIFLVTGDETADTPTHGTITDFDPATDKLVLSMRQPDIGPGQVALSPQTAVLSLTDIETADGPAVEVAFAPRPGFEESTDEAGFARATLLGVSADQLTSDNFYVGVDRSVGAENQAILIDTIVQATSNYTVFQIADTGATLLYGDAQSESEALFGLGRDDNLSAGGFNDIDVYGGPGDDRISGGDFTTGTLFGGEGDDVLQTMSGNELTGGPGVDTFNVSVIDGDIRPEFPTVITDFDPATETVNLSLAFIENDFTLLGDTEVTLEETTRDGIAGTLASAFVRAPDGGDDVIGPQVFLQGVSVADIPEGAITFARPVTTG